MGVDINCDNASLQKESESKVLLLVDWDNVFHSLFNDFGADRMNLEYRFEKLIEWVTNSVGDLLSSNGFIFAPEHFNAYHRQICVKNKLKIVICPKRQTEAQIEDTVDETIIWFGKMMIKHPDVKFLCLVSGDEDFVPLLEEAKKNGIKVALVAPTINSLSTNKTVVRLVDNNPKNRKKMILRLDRV